MCLGLLAACDVFAPADKPTLTWQWRTPIPNITGFANGWLGRPASDGTLVFFEIEGRYVIALEAQTGVERWRTFVGTATSGRGPVSANIVVSGNVVALATVPDVVALNKSTGAILWRYTPASNSGSNQLSADATTLYVPERDHRATAIDLASGAIRWSVDLDPSPPFTVRGWATAVSGDTVYVAERECLNSNCFFTRGEVVALRAADGGELWRYKTNGTDTEASALAVAGRYLVVSTIFGPSGAGGIYGVDRFTGLRAWTSLGASNWIGPWTPAAVSGDTVYYGMQDQRVYAVSRLDGTSRWITPGLGGVDGVVVCGEVLFATYLGVAKLDRMTGRILGKGDTDREFPTTSGGAVAAGLFIAAGHNAFYAYSCAK